MKPMKNLAQYYVDLLVKLGIVRFSILLALALVALAVVVQVGITLALKGSVDDIDIVRSVFFGLLITPWAVYFLSVVVDQLEESRQRLTKLVSKLKDMRSRDQELNFQLQQNIEKLNQEIEERIKAEEAREEAMQDLENEVFQRERTQLELAERTALLRSFIDASPDLIYYRNADGVFSGCNRAMEELTGKKEHQLVGLSPWDVYSKEVAEHIVDTDQKVFADNQALTYEQWLDYPDGRKHYFELRKVPFYSKDGRHLGLVGFGRDITERKRHEESLEKASRDKTTFISTISHELRTPLNGIVGLSRMLLDSQLTEEQRKHMQTINVSAITLGNIFNDIIDMDKFDRRKLELLPVPLNFEDFVAEIESISALMAEQKGLRFDLERLSSLPKAIEVDATRLRQVIWNLVSNAMKFTKEGGVVMTVSADVEEEYATIIIEVEDTGIGIPEDEVEKIFAMYYQVKSGKDNLHAVGTGIGLAVSKQLINMMDGDITVASEEGFGSTFTVSIHVPVVELEEPIIDAKRDNMHLNIFMVEDIELNVTVAKSLLESLGHSVTVAMTGEEALVNFVPDEYDLALLDIQLPDMTGFDVAKYYREHYDNLPPLVALTANVMKDRREYLDNGMDDAISKPLAVQALQAVIDKFFANRVDGQEETVVDQKVIEDEVSAPSPVIETHLLDLDMLESYVDIVGVKPVYDSIKMFEDMMPDYIEVLDSNMTAKDQDGIVSEAHKIKGAAGSIGLKHIQSVAQKAQSPDMPAWWENISDWVEEIKNEYQNDIQVLKSWLEQRK
ncbi:MULTISPECIES: aerobic respiration two-component sensor histidine kinase ArcB [Vibrio]|jgi:two-component system aerobic respiration control sensor histidine kinase ArcB|uniref:aerobic respiration two-component sensor histidine kinase ArcB n=1 Tax=Vibrio TaxID=662 RepID=UPI0002377CBB|nr:MULTISPECIES: aerobic respiration two-component sensor histidine kinase ArcB [Vibrio]ASI97369.1 aerobic respiration two-component sensor histidine kinase ArcB [Vibrio rotiferianus]MDK9775322.1 aerobic respiration two-component sensor histidine kinase ArcB [Vibrio sp. D401a]MDK9804768.1 aerobic respiration two-component sensor histidine kinase ArcB [Vibrio sp. D406a]NOH65460.1 aerobic respiration two-component sensor histidine kinase ArcB [Vibrio rotiferianus]PIB18261.1 aerobic respiration c